MTPSAIRMGAVPGSIIASKVAQKLGHYSQGGDGERLRFKVS